MSHAWRPAPALIVSTAAAGLLVTTAIAFSRPDLLAFALPFVFCTCWMWVHRPTGSPSFVCEISNSTPTEGTSHEWRLRLDGVEGATDLRVSFAPDRNVRWDDRGLNLDIPLDGQLDDQFDTAPGSGSLTLLRTWEALRWGRAFVGEGSVALTSAWSGFQWGPVPLEAHAVRVLPAPAAFAVDSPVPHPVGLLGRNRSSQQGDGAEFADIRAFRAGDRLRHIHWPVSARTGQLHVRTNYAERDTEVTILVDASLDLGRSQGIHGTASTLDSALRAAASISAQFLAVGERVALQVVGVEEDLHVPPGIGQRHHRRVLDVLSLVNPMGAPISRRNVRMPNGDGLFVLISPLLSEVAMQIAAIASTRGLAVIVVDVLDPQALLDRSAKDAHDRIAARLRLLERNVEIEAIGRHGVPVTEWNGPGSLDVALRMMSRRPRPVRGVR